MNQLITVCIPRAIAKLRAIKRFMTGEPCSKGHHCARWVTDGHCYECAKERVRVAYSKNDRADYRKEYSRRKEVMERSAEWIRNNRKKNPQLYAEYDKRKYEKIRSDPVKLAKERERQCIKQKKAYAKDPEKFKKKWSNDYWNNPGVRERGKDYCKDWKRRNPGKISDLNLKHNPIRRASKLQRTPKWLTDEDKELMLRMYKMARAFNLHVDHIIPLQGKLVSGLHVPSNLQLLTPEENHAKRNKYEVK